MQKSFKFLNCYRHHNFSTLKLASLNEDSKPLEQLKTKSNKIERKITKPYRDSFLTSLFSGSFSPDVLIYPEIEREFRLPLNQLLHKIHDNIKIDPNNKVSCDLRELYGVTLPNEYGGLDIPYTGLVKLCESFSFDLFNTTKLLLHICCTTQGLLEASNENILSLLPSLTKGEKTVTLALKELNMENDLLSMNSLLKEYKGQSGSSYTITGTKSWVLHANDADYFMTFAKLEGTQQIVAILIDKSTVEANHISISEPYKMLGSDTFVYDVTFNELPVRPHDIIANDGFKMAHDLLANFRFMVSIVFQGVIRKLTNDIADKLNHTNYFDRKKSCYQLVQQKIGELASNLYLMETMTYLVASLRDDYTKYNTYIEDSLLRVITQRAAEESVEMLVDLNGRDTFFPDSFLQNTWRDYKILGQLEGNNLDNICIDIALRSIKSYSLAKYGDDVLKHRRFWLYPNEYFSRVKNNFSVLIPIPNFNMKTITPNGRKLEELVHPSLKNCAHHLTLSILDFYSFLDFVLKKFAKEITHEQVLLSRLGEWASLLFCTIGVMSRASRAKSIGLNNCDLDIDMSRIIMLKLMDKNKYVLSKADEAANEDYSPHFTQRIGAQYLKQNEYPISHPLNRNW